MLQLLGIVIAIFGAVLMLFCYLTCVPKTAKYRWFSYENLSETGKRMWLMGFLFLCSGFLIAVFADLL